MHPAEHIRKADQPYGSYQEEEAAGYDQKQD
jgi:hypothetical protein